MKKTSFLALVNVVPKGPIVLSRGLRQGDPLSPYIFLLCTEGLANLLNWSLLDKSLMGIRVCSGALTINHLLSIEDSLIFYKANTETSNLLLNILEYAQALGRCISTKKTIMVFSRNVNEVDKIEISSMWGCREMKLYQKYLGLPPMVGLSKKKVFSDIKKKYGNGSKFGKESFCIRMGRRSYLLTLLFLYLLWAILKFLRHCVQS